MDFTLPSQKLPLAGVTYTTILSRGDDDLAQELKRRLLLVDHVYMNAGFHPVFLHPDIEWLAEQQVVTLIKPDLGLLENYARRSGFEVDLKGDIATTEDNVTRVWAAEISEKQPVDTVPLCWFDKPSWPRVDKTSTPNVGRVVNILLKSVPLPSTQVPLEDILGFRSDREVSTKLTRLRYWMRRVAREERKATEIAEELEEALFEYEQVMRIHKLKYEKGVLRTVLTTSAEVVDNLLRFKFKPVVDAMFSVSDQRIQLMEVEQNAPGKEVAYIFATKRQFGSDQIP